MKKYFILLFTFIILIVQVGCSGPQTESDEQIILTEPTVNLTIPAPGQNTGVVFGVMRSSTGDPVGDGIFLAENITYENPELPPTISFSFQYSPRAIVDSTSGTFYFDNLEPANNYVLILLLSPSDYIIVKEGNTPLFISVSEGESVDLGDLSVELP